MRPLGHNTQKFWDHIQPIYKKILQCHYVQRLADGTLPRKWFSHYISQDVLYIIDDSRALSAIAARANNPEETYFFIELAKDGLDIERDLEQELFKIFDIPKTKSKSPEFKSYADYLLESAFNSPYPVAAAALLPCFWVYNRTGEYVFENSAEDNPYKKWIDAYSGGKYREYTQKFIQIVEILAENSDSQIKESMQSAFSKSAEFEFRVFEEASSIS